MAIPIYIDDDVTLAELARAANVLNAELRFDLRGGYSIRRRAVELEPVDEDEVHPPVEEIEIPAFLRPQAE